ncbi:hypothetical protein ALO99_200114 [Pseudomonas coronafaciens pv. porri]|nr:hypothetical protein ALO99_200114 [Pseudomonas coronafaciens pv. porri]
MQPGQYDKTTFYDIASASATVGDITLKSGAINSFRKSKFANPRTLRGLANSNHALRWFSVPLLPTPPRFWRVESYLEWSHAEQAYFLPAPAVGLPPPGGSLHSI